MDKLNLALICGGTSTERQVSLKSAAQVQDALDKEKYNILRFDSKTDLDKLVSNAHRIDIALIILHGPMGEDGTIQGLLELLGIPYQGSGVLGSALAMNKAASKQLYEFAGLLVPAYEVVRKGDPLQVEAWICRLGLPIVVKPASSGSSIGMSIVKSQDGLTEAIAKAFANDRTVLLEAFIKGVELTCSVIGNEDLKALPLVEIIPDKMHDFFDYEAKYTPGHTQEICPARIDDALTEKAQQYGKMAHRALYCKGYSRTDMILKDREIYIIETNTIPGMTPTSLLPISARAAGMSFAHLLDELIRLSLENHIKI
ncbi:MAG: D-alanine--D-alanine ligase [Desulfobacterales bacterium]|jgi:D-alanine-D-alanine ligase|nr:D-alanine--D-alanine ligase [Desulfobacterales bacterium]